MLNFFFKNVKKSISRGSGGRAKNSSKTWSKVTFLLLHRRKSGQKVGKNCHFAGGRVGPSKWPPEAVFLIFSTKKDGHTFSKKLLHRAISIVHVTRGSVSVFMISESTTKLVTAHADSIFKFDDGVLKTRGALVGTRTMGLKIAFMCGANMASIHGALLE